MPYEGNPRDFIAPVVEPDTRSPLQRSLDEAVPKMIRQGKRSQIAGRCAYDGPDGRCIVGHMLTEAEIRLVREEGINQSGVSFLPPRTLERIAGSWDSLDIYLLSNLQKCHDDHPGSHETWVEAFVSRLRGWCGKSPGIVTFREEWAEAAAARAAEIRAEERRRAAWWGVK